MKARIILMSCIIQFLIPMWSFAQMKPKMEVRGVVLDSISKTAIPFATVNLKLEGLKIASIVATREDGRFVIKALKPSKYVLNIVALGFQSRNISLNLSDTLSNWNSLDTIYMVKVSNQIKEVTITANRPLVTQEIDRIAYNMQADPESRSSNIIDMMRKVPMLSVDGEDNVRLKGNTNYKILINGKPSGMVDKNPKDILRSMPASSIQRVEVITTVPAKYEADGLSGIINIVTNRKISDGYVGNLNLNERYPAGGPAVGSSLTVKAGKWGISTFGGGGLANSPGTESSNFRNTPSSSLTQINTKRPEGRNGYLGTDASFELDSLNLLSAQFNISGRRNEEDGGQYSLLRNSDNETIQSYRLMNQSVGSGTGIDASLNYQLGFKADKKRLLTFSYRYQHSGNDMLNSLKFLEAFSYQSPDYRQTNIQRSSEHAFQIDYVRPVKKLNIEAGVKGTFRDNRSNFRYDTIQANDAYNWDEDRSNAFTNSQHILGIYNSYQFSIKKNWGIKVGGRLEQAMIDARFISTETKVQPNYLNFIPSVSIRRKLNASNSLLFGYSRKVKRPGIQHLNPFIDRSNPNFESTGNPDLKPATGNSFELGYSSYKKVSLNLRLTYDSFSGLVFPRLSYQANNGITRSVLENIGSVRYVTTNISINTPLTKVWNLNLNLLPVYGWMSGLANNQIITNEGFMYFLSASTQYRFDRGWRVYASMNVNGADVSLQGTSNNPYQGLGLNIAKGLLKDKLMLSAQVSNPFSKYRYNINKVNDLYFTQESIRQSYLRTFSVNMNYRFGQLKGGVKKNKKEISTDDKGIMLGEK